MIFLDSQLEVQKCGNSEKMNCYMESCERLNLTNELKFVTHFVVIKFTFLIAEINQARCLDNNAHREFI